MGLFSVKIRKKFLAIKNFSVNDTMSGQPNKRLIHCAVNEKIVKMHPDCLYSFQCGISVFMNSEIILLANYFSHFY